LRTLSVIFIFITSLTFAQLPIDEAQFYSRITPGSVLPEKLLTTRTAVFYPYTMTQKELELLQSYFQRSGIDAVVYFENDLLIASRDVSVATAQYLNSREISNLILLQKKQNNYRITVVEYNKKANFVEENQPGWDAEDRLLEELAKKIYLATASGLKRENFLINEFPETGMSINPIDGRRNEFYAIDLKVDPLAVPKFGDEAKDKELEEIMKTFPFKYTLTEPNLSEAELRKQGYLFVLRFVHARAKVAKTLLGYEMIKAESAVVSITYPGHEPHLKNIPANAEVFKFYFKHIDSGNVYLGNKWDAETTWQQALINQIKGFKLEFKIN
jgi:hypothetical protein